MPELFQSRMPFIRVVQFPVYPDRVHFRTFLAQGVYLFLLGRYRAIGLPRRLCRFRYRRFPFGGPCGLRGYLLRERLYLFRVVLVLAYLLDNLAALAINRFPFFSLFEPSPRALYLVR